METLSGNIVDALNARIYPGTVRIDKGKIVDIRPSNAASGRYILPPLVDAHVHVESAMLVPSAFAAMAVRHGTVAAVSDPHEIANVMGLAGVSFMIADGNRTPFKFFFGAPSCVPATGFETAGHTIDAGQVTDLLRRTDIHYLSEMMNFPGVINDDPEVMEKIAAARRLGKPIDGHAPGLTGRDLEKYVAAGITTDHEAYRWDEAVEKLNLGMKILIREGSAAKNFDTLAGLIDAYPDDVMLCSDDKHPDDLLGGHIDTLVRRALGMGLDPIHVFKAAAVNPVRHYSLPVGLLQPGDPADFVVADGLDTLNILETWIDGKKAAENGTGLLSHLPVDPINNFVAQPKCIEDFAVAHTGGSIRAIRVIDGQLITATDTIAPPVTGNRIQADPTRDILKLTVVNRYADRPPATAFITRFGLKNGAIATSVAHDSHNIVAVGTNDADLTAAVNQVIAQKGGLCVACGSRKETLALPVAGLMATADGFAVARQYTALDRMAKDLGTRLRAPFMTLSFMALLVIPSLKLSDKGLFDGDRFAFTPLEVAPS